MTNSIKILFIGLLLLILFGCNRTEDIPPPLEEEIVEPEIPIITPPIILEDNTPILIQWTAPSTRANGDVLSLSEIAGFRIYYGTIKGNYPNIIDIMDSTATETSLVNTPKGIYHLVVTCIDVQGRESAFSNDVMIEI